jgi:hypothetical protein
LWRIYCNFWAHWKEERRNNFCISANNKDIHLLFGIEMCNNVLWQKQLAAMKKVVVFLKYASNYGMAPYKVLQSQKA